MKTLLRIFMCVLLAFHIQRSTSAAVVITSGTDAELRAAIASCGAVSFNFDGTLTLTNTLTVSCAVTIDGTGHSVTLSGGDALRLFQVLPGASLHLIHLTVAHGRVQGTNGSAGGGLFVPGQPGQSVEAGGIVLSNATLLAEDCTFANCSASGGRGGNGNSSQFSADGPGGVATGGAISAHGSSMAFSNCLFAGNLAAAGNSGTGQFINNDSPIPGRGVGGALVADGGTISIINCQFQANYATTYGGGIDVSGGVLTATQSIFTNNVGGGSGGAMALESGSLAANQCSFLQNSVTSGYYALPVSGGAVGVLGGNAQLADCDFANNNSSGPNATMLATAINANDGRGGALAVLGGTALVSRTTFRGNAAYGGNGILGSPTIGSPASGLGGAIYNAGTVLITNCTMALNQARAGSGPAGVSGTSAGGAIAVVSGAATMASCTIASNKVSDVNTNSSQGGGLYRSGGALSILNSILDWNAVNTNASGNAAGAITDLGHNLSSDATPAWSSGSSSNNLDALLRPLAGNGGPTLTMALKVGSPALNTADPATSPAADQRGFPRPNGSGYDIGADEGAGTPIIFMVRENNQTNVIRTLAEPGRSYRLEKTVVFDNWTPLATNNVPQNGFIEFRVPASPSAGFFRVLAQ